MNRLFAAALALALLASFASLAGAQQGDGSQRRVRDNQEAPTCSATSGGSRARPNCTSDPATVRFEQEIKLSIEPRALPNTQCSALIATNYHQRNTTARVENSIKNETCAASSGELTVVVRIKNASGALDTLEFAQAWQRDDDRDVLLSADYPIGENAELVNVRARGVRCTCADTTAASTAAPNPAEEP